MILNRELRKPCHQMKLTNCHSCTRGQVLDERCTTRSEQGIYKGKKALKECIEDVNEILILLLLL